MPIKMLDIKPVLTFKTAKGSQYWVSGTSQSQRMKSFHPEHGIEDQGLKEVYDNIMYLDDAAVNILQWSLTIQEPWWIIKRDNAIAMLTMNGETDTLKFEAGPFNYKTEPQIGLSPFEIEQWKEWREWGGKPTYCASGKVHLGNKITELTYLK